MIALNFTLFVEFGLFMIFLGITNVFIYRPLLRVMDERAAKLDRDREAAESDEREAKTLEARFVAQLVQADQEAAHLLNKAKVDAYQRGRDEMDALRAQAEAEVATYRASINVDVEAERSAYAALLPRLLEDMDRRLNSEGSLL
jgi:F-type H+-transporting ATPase subunit b